MAINAGTVPSNVGLRADDEGIGDEGGESNEGGESDEGDIMLGTGKIGDARSAVGDGGLGIAEDGLGMV